MTSLTGPVKVYRRPQLAQDRLRRTGADTTCTRRSRISTLATWHGEDRGPDTQGTGRVIGRHTGHNIAHRGHKESRVGLGWTDKQGHKKA